MKHSTTTKSQPAVFSPLKRIETICMAHAQPITRVFALGTLATAMLLVGCSKKSDAQKKDATKAAKAATPLTGQILCDRAHTALVNHDGKEGLDLICHDRSGRHAVALRNHDGSFAPSPGWWPSAKDSWCDPAHLKSGDYNGDSKLDMSCHTDDGKHLIALSNGDGTFAAKGWWPSEQGKGPGWCDPAHLKIAKYNNDAMLDLSCHSDDGKHKIALSNGDGTFTAKPWWPSEPNKGPGWCDPSHLRIGDFNLDAQPLTDLSCHSNDGKHNIAFNNKGDGTFSPRAWWPSEPGKGAGWCEPSRLKFGNTSTLNALDLSCHTADGKHGVALNKGDGTFTPKPWWPSEPGSKGLAWCDPSHLRLTNFTADKNLNGRTSLGCHSEDGKHSIAFNNGDGTFTQRAWWPSDPGANGPAWCDPPHLESGDPVSHTVDIVCRSADNRVVGALAQNDGLFVASAWHGAKWPD